MMIAHEKSKWIIKICTSRERNIRFCWEEKKSMNGERRSMPRTKINKNSLLEEESTSQSIEIDFSLVLIRKISWFHETWSFAQD